MIAPIDTHLLLGSADLTRFPVIAGGDAEAVRGAPDAEAVGRLIDTGRLVGALLVLRGRDYGFDNTLIREAAASDPRVRAVAAIDGRDEACGIVACDLLTQPGIGGLRLMEPEKDAGFDWLGGRPALQAWRAVADRAAVMDVHAFPWNRAAVLGVVEKLLSEFSDVRLVLDNCSNIAFENGPPDYGIDHSLIRVAERRQVTLKVSAMSIARLHKAGLEPAGAVAALIARFGADRLCWGSDVLPAGITLEQAITDAGKAVSAVPDADAAAVLAGTARRVFDFT